MKMQRVADLVEDVQLGDPRRTQRLRQTVELLAAKPTASIPEAANSWSQTLATYRLLSNDALDLEQLIAGIGLTTAKRCPPSGVVLAVQDTSSFDFTGHRGGQSLGPLETSKRQGLMTHTTLAVHPAGTPIGVLDQRIWARDPDAPPTAVNRHHTPIEGKESGKWLEGVRASLDRLAGDCTVVTVADREADIYELFALCTELAGDWVIRARHDRKRHGDAASIEQLITASAPRGVQTVEVGARPDQPPRQATVEVRAITVEVDPPRTDSKQRKAHWYAAHPAVERIGPSAMGALSLGVVLVTEPDAPAGVTPLHWLLLTSLPVTSEAEVLTCLHYYRLRWLVERFHYVLKSGCRVEALQLATGPRLQRALAIYSVVAAWILLCTYAARVDPDAPATTIMDEEAWQVLMRVHAPAQPLSAEPPTVREAVRLVAQLGGFLARRGDGEPGVVTIWRGFRRLADIIFAWQLLQGISAPSPSPPTSV